MLISIGKTSIIFNDFYMTTDIILHDDGDFFDRQYENLGLNAQRRYPNSALISEIASHYFRFDSEKRNQIRILELGCGSGANIWMVADEGFDAYGIDFSQKGLDYCETILGQRGLKANLRLADMCELPFEDNYFDFVFDVVSMQHLSLTQHEKSIGDIARVLKPGGRFFSYHLGENSSSLLYATQSVDRCTVDGIPLEQPLSDNGPMCFLSSNDARHLLANANFIDITVDKHLRTYSAQKMYVEYLLIRGKKPEA